MSMFLALVQISGETILYELNAQNMFFKYAPHLEIPRSAPEYTHYDHKYRDIDF